MDLNRRALLRQGGGLLLLAPTLRAARELRCDVAVIGGGTGGCAAALAALRSGLRVVMTEETDWVGGQLTAQAVPPDEHGWIESFGATRSYRQYRTAVRDYYRQHYPLTEEARSRWNLNPGDGSVSKLCHEPKVSVEVIEAMFAPYASSGRLTVLLRHKPVSAVVDKDRVQDITVRCLETGHTRSVQASYFLDATELGDLLPMTRTEYRTGWESSKEFDEPHAPAQAQPLNMQAFTCCFAVSWHPGEDHTIDKPEEYGFWRDYTPRMRPPWSGKLLDFRATEPVRLNEARTYGFDPTADPGSGGPPSNLWLYRRILRAKNLVPSAGAADICLVNWPQNDYSLGNLCETSEAEAQRHLQRAKQLSLSLLYWLQTEAPRHKGGYGHKELKLRPDVVGTEDGLAKYPYIRESRRIAAEFTVREQHVCLEARIRPGQSRSEVTAEWFADSVGIGQYGIDLHASSGGDNYVIFDSVPFQIPMGALLPVRMENLLPAAKNLGVTHLSNGAYRLHPVEWNIGESAGYLAAQAITVRSTPRAIRNTPKLLGDFQARLQKQGVELAWPNIGPRK